MKLYLFSIFTVNLQAICLLPLHSFYDTKNVTQNFIICPVQSAKYFCERMQKYYLKLTRELQYDFSCYTSSQTMRSTTDTPQKKKAQYSICKRMGKSLTPKTTNEISRKSLRPVCRMLSTGCMLLILLLLLLLLTVTTVCTKAAVIVTNNTTITSTTTSTTTYASPNTTWRLISRADWQARTPKSIEHFDGPAPYVILHHSHRPPICYSTIICSRAMRSMQNFHMDVRGWFDIGYTFAIGGDGNVYEGRGYNVVGAHAPKYNTRSIGLVLIGDFSVDLPTSRMLQVAQDFIRYSVVAGKLREDYILYGHRQVRNTECPGNALYELIQQWPHWQEVPNGNWNVSMS